MTLRETNLLEEMTFAEFRDRTDRDSVLLIPLGSQEIQGPMAPMGDFMLTRELAKQVAEATGSIAAPTMPFGHADYFRSVPGGIALSADSFRSVLSDILANFLDHGYRRLVILNGHSGNFPLIDQVIRQIRRERQLMVPCINLWRSIPDEMRATIDPDLGKRAFAHGGDPITSVYLHLFPQLMRMDAAKKDKNFGKLIDLPTAGLSGVRFEGIEIGMAVNVDDHCSNGIAGGDPTRSSSKKGEAFFDFLVKYCAAFIAHFRTVDPIAPKLNKEGEER